MKNAKIELVTLPEVIQQTTLSKSAIYAQIRGGFFPSPKHLGPKRVAWLQSDIDAYKNGNFSKAGV